MEYVSALSSVVVFQRLYSKGLSSLGCLVFWRLCSWVCLKGMLSSVELSFEWLSFGGCYFGIVGFLWRVVLFRGCLLGLSSV